MAERAEPTTQLCINDEERQALLDLLSDQPIKDIPILIPILLDIETGNYITLDD